MLSFILKKISKGKVWNVDGYKYTITDVFGYDGDETSPNFEVNAELPKPFQSYILKKMIDDVQNIISDLILYTGENVEYANLNLLLDNREPLNIFISQPKMNELFETLNGKEEVNNVYYVTQKGDMVSFDLQFFPEDRFYVSDGHEFQFFFKLLVSNIFIEGKDIPLKSIVDDKIINNIRYMNTGDWIESYSYIIMTYDNDLILYN